MTGIKDYIISSYRYFALLAIYIFVSACTGEADSGEPQVAQVELSRGPIQLLGTPADEVEYGSVIDWTFSVKGGTGDYTITYEPNPEIDEDVGSIYSENNLVLTVNKTSDSFEDTFRLQGIANPNIPGGFNTLIYRYSIVIEDGKNVENFDFDITIVKPEITFNDIGSLNEGEANIIQYNNLLAAKQNGNDFVCNDIDKINPAPRVLEGQFAYPLIIGVTLSTPAPFDVGFRYNVESDFIDTNPERSAANRSFARQSVDYVVPEDNTFILKANEVACVIIVYIVDDQIPEERETFRITLDTLDKDLDDIHYISYSSTFPVTIRDNEPSFKYESKQIVLNEGESGVFELESRKVHTNPSHINVYAHYDSTDNLNGAEDFLTTTASESDYTILPSTGVLVVEGFELSTNFSVLINEDDDSLNEIGRSMFDDVVAIRTDIDWLEGVNLPSTVEINEWPLNNDLSNEIVASSIDGETVADFIVDNGFVPVLVNKDRNGESVASLKTFFRDSVQIGDTIEFSHENINVEAKALAVNVEAVGDVDSVSKLVVIYSVDGQAVNTHRGKTDFVVAILERDVTTSPPYRVISSAQFGSEEDDNVRGAYAVGDALYVYGSTTGKLLEGAGNQNANRGGVEGFVYQISLVDNTVNWVTFVGTETDDELVGLDAGTKEVAVLLSQQGTTRKGQLVLLNSSTGVIKDGDQKTFNSVLDDRMVATKYDGNASTARALFDSLGDISSESGRTPSLSRDVFVSSFSEDSTDAATIRVGSSEDDYASVINNVPDNEHYVVGGYTLGTFQNNIKYGDSTEDAFVTILKGKAAGDGELIKNIQFGTQYDDRLLDIEMFSRRKFLGLWQSHNQETDETTYRISAFSVDGRKLSQNP